MADPRILSRIIQLGKELGANISNSIGTKSNVNFLGSGPKDGMLFQKDINPESFLAIGTQKVLPDIEASIGYASGNKLNGFQLEQLEKNLLTMKESLNPTNVVEMGTGGIDSLRAKSGLGERQATEAASDINQVDAEGILASAKVGNPFDNTPVSGNQFLDKFSEIRGRAPAPLETGSATAIMETIPKVDLPGKRAASREFLVNSLKVGDDYPSSTLTDVMSAEDMKFVMEGGGGVMGDPIVLVQKYFGPRIAEMVPNGGTAEEISIFTRRVMDNVEDAKGFKPDEPEFDPLTAKFMEELADGGIAGLDTRQGLRFGGSSKLLKKISNKMIKKAADDIFPTDDYKYDAEMVVEALVENNPKLFKNMLADDLDDALRSELYGLAVSETGTRAAMKIKAGKMERPLFDENGKLNKDAVLADASKYDGLDGRKLPTEKEGMKMAKNMSDEEFEVRGQFPSMSDDMIKSSLNNKRVTPRFQLNVDKAVSELNIPREEAIRIAQLPSDQQKLALQKYMDTDMAQRAELMNYSPKKFDAAKGGRAGYSKGGLAKILEL